jgi:hypothetical protein
VVTFIGVILYIQAVLAAVSAIAALAFGQRMADSLSNQTGTEVTRGSLVWVGIGEIVLAFLLLWVASGIMRGSRGIRVFVAIVEGIRMAAAALRCSSTTRVDSFRRASSPC